ncbi:MAG: AsmA-like C-terminal domain-containing protein [Magnetococcales bacterium]|nr:AsmA-like C-terminal domain-containing protein [Magnetococcales bacterium]
MGLVRRVLKWLLILVVTLCVMLGAGVAGLILHPPDLTPLVPELARLLSRQTGLRIALSGMEWSADHLFSVAGRGVEVADPDSGQGIFAAERILWQVAPQLLFQGELPMAVTLDQARVTVRRDAQGILRLGEHPMPSRSDAAPVAPGPFFFRTITLRQAEVIWLDEQLQVDGHPFRTRLSRIEASGALEPGGRMRFVAEGVLPSSAGGESRIALDGERDDQGMWSVKMRAGQWRMASFLPYLAHAQPLDGLTAPVDLTVEARGGSLDGLQLQWQLALGAGHLAWPELFRWPLPVTRLKAEGRLHHSTQGWNLDVAHFDWHSSHGEAQGRLRLTGLGGKESPFLDLTATASGTPSEQAKFYYPTPIMAPELVHWLDHAFREGHVKQASARIRGHLNRMPAGPHDPAEDLFHIEGDVVGMTLHYLPPLLPLTRTTTHVIFDRYSMTAQVAEAGYGGTRQVKGEVKIADMVDHPVVEIRAESPQVDLNSVWKEVVAHPRLRWDEALGMAGSQVAGQGVATLQIKLPLHAMAQASWSGRLETRRAMVHPSFLEQPLVDVGAVLILDPDRLEIRLNQARADPWPISGSAVVRQYRTPDKANLSAQLETRLSAKQLAEGLAPLLGEEGWIRGDAPVVLEFARQPEQKGFGVRGKVELNAVAGRGRLGWSKKSAEAGELQGEGRLTTDGRLLLKTLRADAGNWKGSGEADWNLSNNRGKVVWKELTWDRSVGRLTLVRTAAADGSQKSKGEGAWRVESDWKRLDLGELWRTVPAGPARLSGADDEVAISPPERSWPTVVLAVRAGQLLLAHGEQAEHLDATIGMELRAVRIEALRMQQRAGAIDGSGEFLWSQRIGSGGYGGHLHLKSEDFGRLLHALDLHEGLEGGAGELEVGLDGFQSPGQRWIDTLSGTARFRFQDGKIRRFGFLATLLGLFSLKDLPKLVIGDRPDLDGSGLHYKDFQGAFAIHDSVWTIDRMKLVSPSMNLVVTGKVDFPRDRVALLVGMRPLQVLDDLINGLPLVGKWVTGDRQSIVETQFDVTGSTAAPQVAIRPVSSLVPGLLRDWIDIPLEWLRRANDPEKAP